MQPQPLSFRLAQRCERVTPSIIREMSKLIAAQPGVISLAGGLPAAQTFPVAEIQEALTRLMTDAPQAALQYAPTEGYEPLREWIAADLRAQGMQVQVGQVLITTGSQQGLDLVGKALIDPDSVVAVQAPTYVGALQAFNPYQPRYAAIDNDAQGPRIDGLQAARDARFFYLVPNFHNPSGETISAQRRDQLVKQAHTQQTLLIEDNPYGDLWFDAPPPAPLASYWPEGVVYLGSFSKVLAPGLRVGFLVAPANILQKIVQIKQAADLHTPILNQRLIYEVVKEGFLARHVPKIRALYQSQRDVMQAALQGYMPSTCSWSVPGGGMFFWIQLPASLDAMELLPKAVAQGVLYVPGATFFAHDQQAPPNRNFLRLSFATVSQAQIEQGIAALAGILQPT